ncbi:hypothetical protein [Rhodoligotrophos ferricapiens]|uniref:hypothetical protein n=1 Tax=Rhodoligotrophos ferricapiens TaxID=3069264 RepID=UPI00315D74E4
MPSSTYKLFAKAMAERKQVVCVAKGFKRELCPIVLGHTRGQERALAYQFAGESTTTLPPGGDWRCIHLADVTEIQLRDGPWHAGSRHRTRQTCVEDVDLDVNPESPYNPRRRL